MLLQSSLEKEFVCQIHGLRERKGGRLHPELEKIRQKLTFVDKERIPKVYANCEGNPWRVSTCISGSRYRSAENKECCQKDMC